MTTEIDQPMPPVDDKPAAVPEKKTAPKKPVVRSERLRKKQLATTKSTKIGNGGIRRMARRGGVKRMGKSVYDDIEIDMKDFVSRINRQALIYMECAGRKTVTSSDVVHALKHNGKTLCGFATSS